MSLKLLTLFSKTNARTKNSLSRRGFFSINLGTQNLLAVKTLKVKKQAFLKRYTKSDSLSKCSKPFYKLRGVFSIKCAGQNNFSANHLRKSAISELFNTFPALIWTYCSQRSIYCQTAAVDSYLLLVWAASSARNGGGSVPGAL
jgi:hypothetical protein